MRSASREVFTLTPEELHETFATIGEAVWHLQFLEDVLVTYVTLRLRLDGPGHADVAYSALAAERRRTLGSLFKDAKAGGLLVGNLADGFRMLVERAKLAHPPLHA